MHTFHLFCYRCDAANVENAKYAYQIDISLLHWLKVYSLKRYSNGPFPVCHRTTLRLICVYCNSIGGLNVENCLVLAISHEIMRICFCRLFILEMCLFTVFTHSLVLSQFFLSLFLSLCVSHSFYLIRFIFDFTSSS